MVEESSISPMGTTRSVVHYIWDGSREEWERVDNPHNHSIVLFAIIGIVYTSFFPTILLFYKITRTVLKLFHKIKSAQE